MGEGSFIKRYGTRFKTEYILKFFFKRRALLFKKNLKNPQALSYEKK
jgi:hypothetical protein